MDDRPDRPAKRAKLSSIDEVADSSSNPQHLNLSSLHRSITPPPSRPRAHRTPISPHHHPEEKKALLTHQTKLFPSPIQLTHIRDFGASSGNNVDTVRLRDILGDPLIRECWQFNYLFDVDFLMSQFDEDVRSLITVKVVHGTWQKELLNRVRITEACQRYSNVEQIVAYMPEPFGTHHTKMMILLRHDECAQVIIHTANMISQDWANMCQAVWRSPLLPLSKNDDGDSSSTAWGSGSRFKRDILAYLEAYGTKKTGSLVKQLANYNFNSVRAALIASVPSRQKIDVSSNREDKTSWGWLALKDALQHVPLHHGDNKTTPHVVTQMSSIATLGQTDKWLREVFFNALTPSTSQPMKRKPRYSIIFPTAEEVRRSLNGYGSGGSIHMKIQSLVQHKQLQYLLPYMRHWAGDVSDRLPPGIRDAGRRRAAPHIKTYVRFTDSETMNKIDWALVTSANLSTQAWGAAANATGEVRISSWEVGVLVWPELFVSEDQKQSVAMVPCFKKDQPDQPDQPQRVPSDGPNSAAIVGFRMPYDLPLTSYGAEDIPWCATMRYTEPDWLGQTWEGL